MYDCRDVEEKFRVSGGKEKNTRSRKCTLPLRIKPYTRLTQRTNTPQCMNCANRCPNMVFVCLGN